MTIETTDILAANILIVDDAAVNVQLLDRMLREEIGRASCRERVCLAV